MKRHITGLAQATQPAFNDEVPDGTYLVEVRGLQYRWGREKPFYLVDFSILQPKAFAGESFSGRLYCTAKALWKLSWFLTDFQYDSQLLGNDELDEKAIVGLRGVIKISHTVRNGFRFLNLEAFAPEAHWKEHDLGDSADTPHGEVA